MQLRDVVDVAGVIPATVDGVAAEGAIARRRRRPLEEHCLPRGGLPCSFETQQLLQVVMERLLKPLTE